MAFTGTIAQLNAAGVAAGAISISATVNGRLLTYVVGAPDFVNAEFAAAFPNGLKGVSVILRTQTRQSMPVVVFIAGATAPPGRRMGHAGAIIAGAAGTAAAKQQAFREAGATIVENPSDIGSTMARVLKERGLA